MLDLFHEILQTLRNNRLRTSLTGLAVAWGIFMLIVLLGVARGVTNAFSENNDSAATNTISIWGGITSKPYHGYREGRRIKMKSDDAAGIVRENRGVSDVLAYGSIDTAKFTTERDFVSGSFNAVYPREKDIQNVQMLAGRFINQPDIDNARRTVVLHRNNARTLFGDVAVADIIGKSVECLGLSWTVVGIYDHPWRESSYTPYTTYKAITGNDDEAYQLTARVDGLTSEADGILAEQGIRATMARRHDFSPDDNAALWTSNRFTQAIAGNQAMNILSLAVWIIGIFTLLSGIVGVSNIMFVSVRERTHEIGIRRAIGAKPRNILTQILAESVAITALFGYIGIVLGTAVLQIVDALFGNSEALKNPTVDFTIAIEVTVALIVAGAVAGLFPALKAIKVKPVEALRDE